MSDASGIQTNDKKTGRWLAVGGIFGAALASSCCVLPLVLVSFGLSGAWIGRLTAFEPYKPIFIAVTALFLAAGFRHVYFRKPAPCAEGSYCARPSSGVITKAALWIATIVVALSFTVDYWAPLFY